MCCRYVYNWVSLTILRWSDTFSNRIMATMKENELAWIERTCTVIYRFTDIHLSVLLSQIKSFQPKD